MKNIKYTFKLTLPAGKAMPAPPVSTSLGVAGVNTAKFCHDFNRLTKDLDGDLAIGVFVYEDLSYDIVSKENMEKYEQSQFLESISYLYRNDKSNNSNNNLAFKELKEMIDSHIESRELAIIDVVNRGKNYAFGKIMQGVVFNPKPIRFKGQDQLYQSLYDWIAMQYAGKIQYGYSHNFIGEYNYHIEIGDNIIVRLTGENNKDRHWVYDRIRKDNEERFKPDASGRRK